MSVSIDQKGIGCDPHFQCRQTKRFIETKASEKKVFSQKTFNLLGFSFCVNSKLFRIEMEKLGQKKGYLHFDYAKTSFRVDFMFFRLKMLTILLLDKML